MREDALFDDQVIEMSPPRRRRPWLWAIIALFALFFLFGSQVVEIYVDSLWFSSVGYESVYWYKFKLGVVLFILFLALTFLIVRLPFTLLNRVLPQLTERPLFRKVSVEDMREMNLLPLLYRPGVWALSAALALTYAVSMSRSWSDFALYLNAQPASTSDPVFGRDVSFYLFTLPVLELLSSWLTTLALLLLAVVIAVSLYISYIERVRGLGGPEVDRRAGVAISGAASFFALALAASTYLSRFDLLEKQHRAFTGIGYTDANVLLPALTVLSMVLVAASIALGVNALFLKRRRLIRYIAMGVAAVWLIGVVILPQAVQYFSVGPNELAKESSFIQHNIDMTRRAFGLDRFEEKPFQPAPTLSTAQIQSNPQMLDNVRLWDPQALQSTFSQIQEIRTYYEFRVPDIDRYTINGRERQVLLAAREMNVDQLPEQSRNWINQHLVYTHGYGVTMCTANEFTPEGLPNLLLKNMPVESSVPEIKITRPEIYFGDATNTHVYVGTRPQGTSQPEFNYPAPGDEDAYSQYEGKAGISVGGVFRQSALAYYLGDGTNLLFSDYINPDSRVLIRRNVVERARSIAPFLLYDDDPYIVIGGDGRLFWLIDAYTHSNRYPYSTLYPASGRAINYIRNSVKVAVDAYEGDVRFYIFDTEDPVIRSYQSIFPNLFVASSEMPGDLRKHIRYPELLAATQARAYTLYHMTSAQTFYYREDQWALASIDTASQQGVEPQPMHPYYVMMSLPGVQKERLEFISILPFTPTGQGRNNMIGWMAARSDSENFGETLIYTFPKNVTVAGPAQIKARINQDPDLSALLTLWNQQGSNVLRGNLQVIPIADSLLYVEPFYLQAVNSPQPELRQVAIATQDRLATGKTFDEALKKLFTELEPTSAPPIETASSPQPDRAEPRPAPAQPPAGDVERLARQAQQLLADYERLTAEGKHREAGEKLDQLKQAISEMNRKRGGS
jgi:uncharacterized membrane protein (UPF0182 family)